MNGCSTDAERFRWLACTSTGGVFQFRAYRCRAGFPVLLRKSDSSPRSLERFIIVVTIGYPTASAIGYFLGAFPAVSPQNNPQKAHVFILYMFHGQQSFHDGFIPIR
jgi:hypothetical protein